MRTTASSVTVVMCLLGVAECATSPHVLLPPPNPMPAAPFEFRSARVAGFVVGERRDLEVNAVAVQELRSRLKAMTSARVVEEPPLRTIEEAAVIKSQRAHGK